MSTDGPKSANHIEIYTDGGCEPNPGPGGYGVVLLHPKKRAETSGGFRKTTNNRMEIYAAIAGLEMLKQPCNVTLYSDSEYLVNSMTEGWVLGWKKKKWWKKQTERVPNFDLWEKLLALCEKHQVEFRWVKGMQAIQRTSDAINFQWRRCGSPICRWMRVTRTNSNRMAFVRRCGKVSRAGNV